MSPDELQKLNDVTKKLNDFLDIFYRTNFPDKVVFDKDVYITTKFYLKDGSSIPLGATTGSMIGVTGDKLGFLGKTPAARQGAISSPSGGATIDSQARVAIDSIRTVLINFGLTS